MRRIKEEWGATLRFGIEFTPAFSCAPTDKRHKERVIPLEFPSLQTIKEKTEAKRIFVSETDSGSEPIDRGKCPHAIQGGAKIWEEVGLENPMNPASPPASSANIEFDQSRAVFVTPLASIARDGQDLKPITVKQITLHVFLFQVKVERCRRWRMTKDQSGALRHQSEPSN